MNIIVNTKINHRNAVRSIAKPRLVRVSCQRRDTCNKDNWSGLQIPTSGVYQKLKAEKQAVNLLSFEVVPHAKKRYSIEQTERNNELETKRAILSTAQKSYQHFDMT